ncbi:hypothetical protein SAMN02927923_01726 [Microvirga guangxiensis]|uniref:Uncharacterized protein n=1 Tax=Microvirga guangxiensis TaxID=549386 RepID=A0A1G5H178_9HYPH|nr:hypothetical protein SAMN02927923_01726 [Microvirga guangxiensis]
MRSPRLQLDKTEQNALLSTPSFPLALVRVASGYGSSIAIHRSIYSLNRIALFLINRGLFGLRVAIPTEGRPRRAGLCGGKRIGAAECIDVSED